MPGVQAHEGDGTEVSESDVRSIDGARTRSQDHETYLEAWSTRSGERGWKVDRKGNRVMMGQEDTGFFDGIRRLGMVELQLSVVTGGNIQIRFLMHCGCIV